MTNHPFTDVPDDAFYSEAVQWAWEEGITTGVTPTLFAPSLVATRGELVTMIHRSFFPDDVVVDPDPDPIPDPDPTPDPDPDPDPIPDPIPTAGNVDLWLPEGFIPKVDLPEGFIGANEGAEVIQAPIVGGLYENVIIDVPAGFPSSAQAIKGGAVLNGCTVLGHGRPVNALIADSTCYNTLISEVGGDGLKGGAGDNVSATDSVITMTTEDFGGGTDKHFDGAQAHADAHMEMERVLVLWEGLGVRANTTGAVFTQMQASLYLRDVTILDPAGTYQIVRLSGTGTHDVDRIHVSGVQGLTKHGKLAPTHCVKLTNGMGKFTLYNDVPGALDWLIE